MPLSITISKEIVVMSKKIEKEDEKIVVPEPKNKKNTKKKTTKLSLKDLENVVGGAAAMGPSHQGIN